MSPEQPGAEAPSDPVATLEGEGGRPRFRQEIDPVDEAGPVDVAIPDAAVAPPPKVVPPTGRRRLLDDPDPSVPKTPRRPKVRARKVRRIVRHVEPWSVLKISVLFFLSIFLIICVASAVLWNAARSAGAIDDVESFITSLGFGNCEDIPGQDSAAPTTTSTIAGPADQLGGGEVATTVPIVDEPEAVSSLPDEDGKCAEGQRLVGGFKFEDDRIFQAFGLGGVVLVLAGAAASVVMTLLFNLISDLTGGVRVTVLEEETAPRSRRESGSPVAKARD